MARPVIILGAGASYDYVAPTERTKHENWQPPLATGLFNQRAFEGIINQFPAVKGLASSVLSTIGGGGDVEDHLRSLQDRVLTSHDERPVAQLGASLFYFQKLFQEISRNYDHAANNYEELINRLDAGGGGCVATFNYDTLFDHALQIPEAPTNDFEPLNGGSGYIDGRIKLIKLHGSCDWQYILDNWTFTRGDFKEPYDYVIQHYDKLIVQPPGANGYTVQRQERDIVRSRAYKVPRGDGTTMYLYPAVAIPIARKNSFVCPSHHIAVLKQALETTDRILIVGWKAGDDHLLDMIATNLKQPTRIAVVVSKDKDVNIQVQQRLEEMAKRAPQTRVSIDMLHVGFTDFLRNKAMADTFFN